MSKRFGTFFVMTGVVLVLLALLLFVYNQIEDQLVGNISANLLDALKNQIPVHDSSDDDVSDTTYLPDVTDTVDGSTPPEVSPGQQMPVVRVEGYDFIGYISIPDINIELPILNDWDYDLLNVAPCRQSGSLATDDLVIVGHNFSSHFAGFEYLEVNDVVKLTNMLGHVIEYKISKVDILDGEEVDPVLNSDHDLVLYTCTFEGTTRIVVFCDRV